MEADSDSDPDSDPDRIGREEARYPRDEVVKPSERGQTERAWSNRASVAKHARKGNGPRQGRTVVKKIEKWSKISSKKGQLMVNKWVIKGQ